MSKNKKKDKNPPGILEWIVDFFITPIVNGFGNVLKPILDAVNATKISEEAKKSSDALAVEAERIRGLLRSSSPLAPDVAKNLTDVYYAQAMPALYGQIGVNMAIEAATLGQVDVSPGAILGLPYYSGTLQNVIDIWRSEFTEGVYPSLRRYQLKKFTPMLPESYRLAIAVAKGIISPEIYKSAMAESGLSDFWADVWQEENYLYPNLEQTFELYWRGAIDDSMFTLILLRNGYQLGIIEQFKSLRDLIPPASDLVTMVVREAFDPRYVTPAPDVFAENMSKKGFSRVWSDRYWTMHWVPIPLTQAYENLHRGYWTKEQFLEALRIADLHPMWREDVYNVAFGPPSIREMGYGYDVGAYSLEDIVKYRRWGGLSEEDAEKAGAAMVAYRTEAERNAVRTEYMYLFAKGKMPIEDFEAKLAELSTSPPAIALWLERAKAYKERVTKETTPEEPPSITRSVAQWLFENGIRTEEWLRATLNGSGFVEDSINAFVDQSKHKIDEAKKKAAEITYRQLTATQIRDLYRLRKLKADDLTVEFQKIGYSLNDAKRISELLVLTEELPKPPTKVSRAEIVHLYEYQLLGVPDADMKKILDNIIMTEGARSPTKALYGEFLDLGYETDDAVRLTVWTAIDVTLPTLKAVYGKGWISAEQLYNGLREIGIPDAKAGEIMATIVKAEQPARTAPEKDLTKAEIIKGAKIGVLTASQASELLQGIGYDQNEAMYLLYINAVVARGDPEGYWEMRKVVEQQKRARGEPFKEIPDDLIMLELQIKDKKAEIEKLKKEKASEEAIGAAAVALAGLETNMRVTLGKLKLA